MFVLGFVISSFYFTTILYTQFISINVQTWVLITAAVSTVLAGLMIGLLFAKIKRLGTSVFSGFCGMIIGILL